MNAWGFLKRRALVAAVGALLIGSGGAVIAAAQASHPAALASQGNTASVSNGSTTNGSSTGAGAATATPPTTLPPPTATSIPPTPTTPPPPPPTPTPLVPGTQAHISGNVVSVSSNSFVLRWNGANYTVNVSATGTTYNGSLTTLSQIQSKLNNGNPVSAEVIGVWQATSPISVDATIGTVNAQAGDS